MSRQALRWSCRNFLIRLALPAIAVSAIAARPAFADWKRIDSPNFVVIGDVSEGQLRDVAVRFEGFRETLSRVLSQRATATAVPTVVIVFPSDKALTPFKPRFKGKPVELSGLFVPRSDINYIAVLAGGEPQDLRVIFHEYAHLIISNVSHSVPAWLNEGLAEYYSTYEMLRDGREALLGRPVVSHLQELNNTKLLTLDELLKVDHDSPLYNEGERRSVFYAQSWALTHLILLGQPPRLQQLGNFMTGLDQGQSEQVAWQSAFGPDMDKALRGYIRQNAFRYYQYKFSDKLTTFNATPTPLAQADVQAFLGDFLTRQQRFDEASQRLSSAATLDASNARVRIARARLAIERRDFAAAEKLLLEPGDAQDWLVSYGAGVSLVTILERQGSTADAAYLTAARQSFDAVIAAHGDVPNALARRASLELRSGSEPSDKTVLLIARARALAPGRSDYAFIHAEVLARRGQFADARNLLGPMLQSTNPANIREPARKLMTYVVQLEQYRKTQRAAAPSAGARTSDATPPATDSTTSTPTEPVERGATEPAARASAPVFRVLQSGEQRLEGKLDRIDCAGASATFRVQTPDGPVVVRATRLSDVDFITYRDDLSGNVGCGPMKEPMMVYVTWKEGKNDGTPAQGSKQVVAIEFLPKDPR
jgi:tetratricopeptide (TPR) repeat protein